jgi:hypothetical protein
VLRPARSLVEEGVGRLGFSLTGVAPGRGAEGRSPSREDAARAPGEGEVRLSSSLGNGLGADLSSATKSTRTTTAAAARTMKGLTIWN